MIITVLVPIFTGLVVAYFTIPNFKNKINRLFVKGVRLPESLPDPQPQTLGQLLSSMSASEAKKRLTEGLHSLDIAGHSLDAADRAKLSFEFSRLWGNNYVGKNERKEITLIGPAGSLWDIMVQDGWSKERFNSTLDSFKRKAHSKKWSLSEFLSCSPKADLHDNDWYLDQTEHDRAQIECYVTPGKKCLSAFLAWACHCHQNSKKSTRNSSSSFWNYIN